MTSPADVPAPAQREADSAWGTKIALGVVGFILLMEFVLPGFVAAGFSREGNYIYLLDAHAWLANYDPRLSAPSPVGRAGVMVLAPASWLMNRSDPVRRFYIWQYRFAGGDEAID